MLVLFKFVVCVDLKFVVDADEETGKKKTGEIGAKDTMCADVAEIPARGIPLTAC